MATIPGGLFEKRSHGNSPRLVGSAESPTIRPVFRWILIPGPTMQTDSVFCYPITVGVDDLDEMNHVNNLVYLKWCLRAAWAHSGHVGWPSQRYHQTGFGFVVRRHQIKYKVPALLGDDVIVKTWVETMDRVSSVRRYYIVRADDDRRLVEAETTWAFINLKTGRLARIPREVRESFGVDAGPDMA